MLKKKKDRGKPNDTSFKNSTWGFYKNFEYLYFENWKFH